MKKVVAIILMALMLLNFVSCEAVSEAPRIGENGNWWVGDQDLGVAAQGPAGKDAEQNEKQDAVSVTEIAKTLTSSTVVIRNGYANSYSMWTGFVVSEKGYIITSYGIVEDLQPLEVTLHNGQKMSGELVAYNEAEYIAIIKVGAVLPAVPIGDSDAILMGETVYSVGAMGDTLLFMQGLISATDYAFAHSGKGYAYETKMFLTDASNAEVNCGCLANKEGKVIGLSLGVNSIRPVVPINIITKLVEAVKKTGRCDDIETGNTKFRPLLGFNAKTVKKGDAEDIGSPATRDGVLVWSVNAGSLVEEVLQTNDIIYEIDGTTVSSIEQLHAKLCEYRLGDRIHLKIDRLGELLEVDIDLSPKQ